MADCWDFYNKTFVSTPVLSSMKIHHLHVCPYEQTSQPPFNKLLLLRNLTKLNSTKSHPQSSPKGRVNLTPRITTKLISFNLRIGGISVLGHEHHLLLKTFILIFFLYCFNFLSTLCHSIPVTNLLFHYIIVTEDKIK